MKKSYQTKLRKFTSGSHFILVPLQIRKDLEICENDTINIEIEKCDEELETKDYKCLSCDYIFGSSDEVVYCPSCGNEDEAKIIKIKEEEKEDENVEC